MKKIFAKTAFSTVAVLVGLAATVLPFHLFNNLTNMQICLLFFAEILVYFLIISAFFLAKDARAVNEEKRAEYRKRHEKRVERRRKELEGIRVNNYDIAA